VIRYARDQLQEIVAEDVPRVRVGKGRSFSACVNADERLSIGY
jgi:hypothetical protein